MGKHKKKRKNRHLPQQLPEPNPQANPAQPQRVEQSLELFAAGYSGPLPPPAMLVQYNDAFPGAAERIMAMAERQAEHRQKLESHVVRTRSRNETSAMVLGFFLALVGIVGGLFLVYNGKDISGLAAFFGALGGLIATTIFGRVWQKKELAEKRKPFEQQRR